MRSRVSSTFERDAASTSSRSTNRPSSISTHALHSPHGFEVTPVSQLMHLARMRASVVLPTPRVPEKRNAWWSRSASSALTSARATWACPTSCSKLRGRHLRAST